jgi:biopolymer transport protein TolQ
MSFMHLFLASGPVVKAVMISLVLASVISWAIIIQKAMSYRRLKMSIDEFEKMFWSGQTIEATYAALKSKAEPMGAASLFMAAMNEWLRSTDEEAGFSSEGIKERISRIIDVKLQQETEKMRSFLVLLATVGSAGPFVGLFGTVWGIMASFQAIASSKTTDLSVVAPGIAEALFATAMGLIAAIPAVVGYNMLATRAGHLSARLANFAEEFSAIVSRNLDKKKVA